MSLSRREFLRAGTLALGGLGLADLLAARAASRSVPDTAVILFWMWGGPSQLETFDMKPGAPSNFRGPFRPIATSVPGIEICELFPRLARQAHRYNLVRSLHHEMSAHNDGSIEVLTGKTPTRPDPTSTAVSEHPDFGMIASRLRGANPAGLPQYIGVPTQPFMTRPAYLGVSHRGFATGNPALPGFRPPNLVLNGGLDGTRLTDRQGLRGQFDRLRRGIDETGQREGMDQFYRQAFHLLTSRAVAGAFDLEREPANLRERYGRHLWGQSCLLARRLAEAGTAVVTIDALAPQQGTPLYFSWDDHANAQPGWDMAKGMRWRAEYMDPALSALIEDIHQRGLERKIMVVAVGEFGRTPRVNTANACIGRDHWPQAMTALVAGGGRRSGTVIGATNARSEHPVLRPLHPQDLLATMYRHLGIDPAIEFNDFTGRPHRILYDGTAISELL